MLTSATNPKSSFIRRSDRSLDLHTKLREYRENMSVATLVTASGCTTLLIDGCCCSLNSAGTLVEQIWVVISCSGVPSLLP